MAVVYLTGRTATQMDFDYSTAIVRSPETAFFECLRVRGGEHQNVKTPLAGGALCSTLHLYSYVDI
jgi:hypothetical protein